jgi:hypothetical protein
VVYLNSLEVGWFSTWVGFIVLGMYLPIWLYTQYETRQHAAAMGAVASK